MPIEIKTNIISRLDYCDIISSLRINRDFREVITENCPNKIVDIREILKIKKLSEEEINSDMNSLMRSIRLIKQLVKFYREGVIISNDLIVNIIKRASTYRYSLVFYFLGGYKALNDLCLKYNIDKSRVYCSKYNALKSMKKDPCGVFLIYVFISAIFLSFYLPELLVKNPKTYKYDYSCGNLDIYVRLLKSLIGSKISFYTHNKLWLLGSYTLYSGFVFYTYLFYLINDAERYRRVRARLLNN